MVSELWTGALVAKGRVYLGFSSFTDIKDDVNGETKRFRIFSFFGILVACYIMFFLEFNYFWFFCAANFS